MNSIIHMMDQVVADSKSFIFTLVNPNDIPPTRYKIQHQSASIFDYASYGPTFGHDIYVASNSNTNTSSSIYFPDAYKDTTGRGKLTFTGYPRVEQTVLS